MTSLRLSIENVPALPDGGPLTYSITGRRGIDIGRDAHLDWVLPDPNRVVSGKHAEIRYREGGYWLHDVSANGTYLNGDSARLGEPRRLRTGDRFEIGHYIIGVVVTGESLPPEPRVAPVAAPSSDLWSADPEEAAPPVHIPREKVYRPLHAQDFIDSASDLPAIQPGAGDPWSVPAPAAPEPRFEAPRFEKPRPRAPEPPAPEPAAPEPAAPAPLAWAEPEPAPPPDPIVTPMPVPARPEPMLAAPELRAAEPPPAPMMPRAGAGDADWVRRFEIGAGLPPGSLKDRPPEALAEEIGRMMRTATAELKMLMQARSESKSAMRSASHTIVQALNNNPIPFAPTAEDALRIMLAPQGKSYLAGEAALKKTFETLKAHQVDTFVAMQAALDGLVRELDPDAIEESLEPEGKVGGLFANRRARLWDVYRSRWQALGASHPDGIRGVFLSLFTARYDKRGG